MQESGQVRVTFERLAPLAPKDRILGRKHQRLFCLGRLQEVSMKHVGHDVNVFAKVFSCGAASGCVVAAELPLIGVDRHGCWSVDEQVADFPPK